MFIAIIAGVAISLANASAAVVIAINTEKLDFERSSRIVFGSMAIRMAISIAIVIFMLLFVKLQETSFVLSFFISGFIFTLTEIFFLNYRANLLNLHKNVPKQRK